MTAWEAVLLGIVQGLTEFLPVSSSGHLVLAETLLDIKENGIAFEIFAHFGTLMAVVTVFKSDFLQIFREMLAYLTGKPQDGTLNSEGKQVFGGMRLTGSLVVGTVPAAIIGYAFRGTFERSFAHPEFVSVALIVTGVILILSRFAREKGEELSYGKGFMIGLAQVIAFFPGISRSGTTITTGLLLGVSPFESARFSFLLAVPLILGVTGLKFFELLANPLSFDQTLTLIIGCVASYASGLLAIKWLLSLVQKGKFDRFAYYCITVGILGVILFSL
ncbi:MAG: undecaprenyl-diphosphate phosphatase [bacterium]